MSVIRQLVKKWVPAQLLYPAWTAYSHYRARPARAAFEQASPEPAWLGWAELEHLQKSYPVERVDYTYEDPAVLIPRAAAQIALMLAGVPAGERAKLHHFLDLGAWDGTVCQLLAEQGKFAVATDIRGEGYTAEARQSQAWLTQMNAHGLAIADNSFDFVFSFNSFEHFPRPDLALQEAIRVVRPGGYIYLNFGPLWLAPKGAHQFAISVPYNQCLFPRELLIQFAQQNEIPLTEFFWMNEWTAGQFRQLWQKMTPQLEIINYYEELAPQYTHLIEQYPTCFKSKSSLFDDFLVSQIMALFRKRPG